MLFRIFDIRLMLYEVPVLLNSMVHSFLCYSLFNMFSWFIYYCILSPKLHLEQFYPSLFFAWKMLLINSPFELGEWKQDSTAPNCCPACCGHVESQPLNAAVPALLKPQPIPGTTQTPLLCPANSPFMVTATPPEPFHIVRTANSLILQLIIHAS